MLKKILCLVLAVFMLLPTALVAYADYVDTTRGDATYNIIADNKASLISLLGQPTHFTVPERVTLLVDTTCVVSEVNLFKINSTLDLLETFIMPSSVVSYKCGLNELPELKKVVFSDNINSLPVGALRDCPKLTEVKLPDKLTVLDAYLFENCTSLSEIELPESLTTIGTDAFYNTGLQTVTIPKNVEKIETETSYGIDSSAFSSCKSLTAIHVAEENQYYSSEDGVLFNKDKTVLLRYPEGKTDTTYKVPDGVSEIAELAFYSCNNLERIEFSESVTKISDMAFSGCESLRQVDLPANLKYIGLASFAGCPIEILSVLPHSLKEVSGAFTFHLLTDVYYDGTEEEWNSILTYRQEINLDGTPFIFTSFYPEVTMHFKDDTPEEPDVPDEPENTFGIIIDSNIYTVKVNGIEGSEIFAILDSSLDIEKVTAWDISLIVNGVETQPDGDVTVRIPVPAGYDPEKCKVYYIDPATGALTDMNAYYEDGFFVFTTDHFSIYAIVELHEHNYTSATTPPTCTAKGYTTYTCTCGNSYVGDYVNAKGHSYRGVITTAPDCTTKGVKTFTCSDCTDTYTEDVTALGHNETIIPAVPATCIETGMTQGKKCSVCGVILVAQTEIPIVAHTDENADGRCDHCNTQLSIAAMKGDLDDDGQITPADARIVLRAAVGLDKLTDSQKTIADINRDGMITPSDARSVLRCAVGLDTF